MFSLLATQEYIVATPAASVTKVVLTIPVTVDRNSTATRINEAGQLELVAPNTPRYNFDPVTLQPLGLLIEPVVTNKITGDMVGVWTKQNIEFEDSNQTIGSGFPTYLVTGNGMQATHVLFTNVQRSSAVQTMSIYVKSGTNTLIQLAVANYSSVHANFDLFNGTITAQGTANISATITPVPNGFYRCSLTFASNLDTAFVLWFITPPTSPRQ